MVNQWVSGSVMANSRWVSREEGPRGNWWEICVSIAWDFLLEMVGSLASSNHQCVMVYQDIYFLVSLWFWFYCGLTLCFYYGSVWFHHGFTFLFAKIQRLTTSCGTEDRTPQLLMAHPHQYRPTNRFWKRFMQTIDRPKRGRCTSN